MPRDGRLIVTPFLFRQEMYAWMPAWPEAVAPGVLVFAAGVFALLPPQAASMVTVAAVAANAAPMRPS